MFMLLFHIMDIDGNCSCQAPKKKKKKIGTLFQVFRSHMIKSHLRFHQCYLKLLKMIFINPLGSKPAPVPSLSFVYINIISIYNINIEKKLIKMTKAHNKINKTYNLATNTASFLIVQIQIRHRLKLQRV